MKPWKIVLPLAGLPIVGLLAWGLTQDPRAAPTPLVGASAPEFALETLAGDTLRLADLGSQPLLVNYWASWCLPCRDEHPLLVRANQEYGTRIRVIGVVYQDTRGNAMRWYQERGGDWTNVLDPRSRTAIEWGVRGVPETFFVSRDRRILYHHVGPVTPPILGTWIPRLLAPDSTAARGS
ncbi:MAG: redoxin domain-containing protein [Gemmatimonadetes bacterium]|nr:redoxin domain-containing protein [Gemmatimonadota bacterium]